MTKVLYGKNVAVAINAGIISEANNLIERGIVPTLAMLRVGERDDDIAYERSALRRCAEIGIGIRHFILDASTTMEEILSTINMINGDETIHGCLMFRPLPNDMDENTVCNALLPEKDVDGITDISLAAIINSSSRGFPPCTAQACIELLNYYGIDLAGKRTVVLGRSLVIGKPVAMLALAENATVTICHSMTTNLASECSSADVLITATGNAGLVNADYINPKGVVIDVGISVDEDGNLCGDVNANDAYFAKAYTPVPGGIGEVTTSILAKHVIEATLKAATV